jgi:hypothetical protein
MAAGISVSVKAVTSRHDHIVTNLKATAVKELLDYDKPALVAQVINISSHLSLIA